MDGIPGWGINVLRLHDSPTVRRVRLGYLTGGHLPEETG
jgi:hypothetical protein